MGVANTLPNYKSFTFDGTNSRAYGVYITGRGVFNAPERNVEMVEIPGRNGAYALDKGNFNNIEVTYPAGIFADTEADFAQAVSDLRNFLCSKNGYCRLEDDYNSGEYRMAIYKSGLEVDHDMLTAGEFNIVFECKPQRWLTSGETAVSVASGGKVTNPTLFEAKPLLEVTGYGTIDIGGSEIEIANVTIGNTVLYGGNNFTESQPPTLPVYYDILLDNTEFLNSGDSINASGITERVDVQFDGTITSVTVGTPTGFTVTSSNTENVITLNIALGTRTFTFGTSSYVSTGSVSITVDWTRSSDGHAMTTTGNIYCYLYYNGSNKIQIYRNVLTGSSAIVKTVIPSISADSTKSATGTTYIDFDIGEAYAINNGEAISLNNIISIPPELPTLPSGDTTITYDNTYSSVKVTPRWWKV